MRVRVEVLDDLVPCFSDGVLVALLLAMLDIDDLLVQMEQGVQDLLFLGGEARGERQLVLADELPPLVTATVPLPVELWPALPPPSEPAPPPPLPPAPPPSPCADI